MSFLGTIKKSLILQSESLLKKAWGKDFLTKEETIRYLNGSILSETVNITVNLPEVRDAVDGKILFAENTAKGSRNQVWSLNTKASVQRIGSVMDGDKVLETDYGFPNLYTDDFGGKHVFHDFLNRDKRPTIHADVVVAPWSHYFRPEYFGYVCLVAAKIARIKAAAPKELFDRAIVSYPLLRTSYERELLSLFGFTEERIIDSRNKKVTFNSCLLGNSDDWSYPNPADIRQVKQHIDNTIDTSSPGAGDLIYISRVGRRVVKNEAELVKMLEKFNFNIIEDKPRSIAEQYAIYNNAKFIIGPHGGSFTNIIWCKPGTHLFELFAPTYVYNFFLYLCQILDMKYSAACSGPLIPNYSYKSVNDDMVVDVEGLERYLTAYFGG